jgi:histidinol-phosphatase (PHP family)
LLFNLHTHTSFSDGSDDPEKYVEEAIKQGFHTLGFSDHSPVPFENTFAIREGKVPEYCDIVRDLTKKLEFSFKPQKRKDAKNAISESSFSAPLRLCGKKRLLRQKFTEILLGLEVDYIPGITLPIEHYRKRFSFDYFIGSVHFVKSTNSNDLWFIDGPDIEIFDRGLKEIFGGNIREAVTTYYRQLNEMIVNEKPDIIGHLDKIKMYNRGRYFSESDDWYVALVDETLDLAANSGCVIEVNTRGIYKKRSESLFPGTEILKKVKALDIPITLSSDAHKPSELSLYFPEAKKILADLGFKTLVIRNKQGWEEVPLH